MPMWEDERANFGATWEGKGEAEDESADCGKMKVLITVFLTKNTVMHFLTLETTYTRMKSPSH